MSANEDQLKRIQDKLQQLVKQYAAIKKDNQSLKTRLDKANTQLATQTGSMDAMKQQADVLRLNAGKLKDTEKKEFEKRINNYIREIDKCIALLGE